MKRYATVVKRWQNYCTEVEHDCYEISFVKVLEFLEQMFESGVVFTPIKLAHSAMSELKKLSGTAFSEAEQNYFDKILKAYFNIKPPVRLKDKATWDINVLLNLFVKEWGENDELPCNKLAGKVVLLIMIINMCRRSEVMKMKISTMSQKLNGDLVFNLDTPTKCFSIYNYDTRPELQFLVAPRNTKTPKLCPVLAMEAYLRRVESIRGEIDEIFILLQHPSRPAAPQTIARWGKDILSLIGLEHFTLGSTRSASACAAILRNVPLEVVLQRAKWTQAQTFVKNYMRPIAKIKKRIAARAEDSRRKRLLNKKHESQKVDQNNTKIKIDIRGHDRSTPLKNVDQVRTKCDKLITVPLKSHKIARKGYAPNIPDGSDRGREGQSGKKHKGKSGIRMFPRKLPHSSHQLDVKDKPMHSVNLKDKYKHMSNYRNLRGPNSFKCENAKVRIPMTSSRNGHVDNYKTTAASEHYDKEDKYHMAQIWESDGMSLDNNKTNILQCMDDRNSKVRKTKHISRSKREVLTHIISESSSISMQKTRGPSTTIRSETFPNPNTTSVDLNYPQEQPKMPVSMGVNLTLMKEKNPDKQPNPNEFIPGCNAPSGGPTTQGGVTWGDVLRRAILSAQRDDHCVCGRFKMSKLKPGEKSKSSGNRGHKRKHDGTSSGSDKNE